MSSKSRRSVSRCSFLVLVLLSGCAAPSPTAPAALPTSTSTPAPLRKLESVECRTDNPQQIPVECYDLFVPEDRSRTDSAMIWLHVAIFRTKSSSPAPDPILYLSGGPGAPGIPFVLSGLQSFSGFAGARRDIIVFDQRGTGQSQPNLDCPEVVQSWENTLDEPVKPSEFFDVLNPVWSQCHDRLVSQGIELGAYSSVASAADVEDLRRALNIKSWNLFGISYGTRLALTIMRDFPQSVRSAVLDSVYPLPETLKDYDDNDIRGNGSLQYLVDQCEADAECAQAYPDLGNTLAELVLRLNENPVDIQSQIPMAVGSSKAGPTVSLTGDRLLQILFFMMYSVYEIPYIPRLIAETSKGDLHLISRYVLRVLPPGSASGMGVSVSCVDDPSVTTDIPAIESPTRLEKLWFDYLKNEYNFPGLCQAWVPNAAQPKARPAFTSSIPTLLLAGEYDPATPVSYARLAEKSLTNSYLYVLPGFGHSLTAGDSAADGCVGILMASFWKDPIEKPEDACVAKLKPRKFI